MVVSRLSRDLFTTTVKNPPLSLLIRVLRVPSGYSTVLGMGMLKCGITPRWGCFLAVAVKRVGVRAGSGKSRAMQAYNAAFYLDKED